MCGMLDFNWCIRKTSAPQSAHKPCLFRFTHSNSMFRGTDARVGEIGQNLCAVLRLHVVSGSAYGVPWSFHLYNIYCCDGAVSQIIDWRYQVAGGAGGGRG